MGRPCERRRLRPPLLLWFQLYRISVAIGCWAAVALGLRPAEPEVRWTAHWPT